MEEKSAELNELGKSKASAEAVAPKDITKERETPNQEFPTLYFNKRENTEFFISAKSDELSETLSVQNSLNGNKKQIENKDNENKILSSFGSDFLSRDRSLSAASLEEEFLENKPISQVDSKSNSDGPEIHGKEELSNKSYGSLIDLIDDVVPFKRRTRFCEDEIVYSKDYEYVDTGYLKYFHESWRSKCIKSFLFGENAQNVEESDDDLTDEAEETKSEESSCDSSDIEDHFETVDVQTDLVDEVIIADISSEQGPEELVSENSEIRFRHKFSQCNALYVKSNESNDNLHKRSSSSDGSDIIKRKSKLSEGLTKNTQVIKIKPVAPVRPKIRPDNANRASPKSSQRPWLPPGRFSRPPNPPSTALGTPGRQSGLPRIPPLNLSSRSIQSSKSSQYVTYTPLKWTPRQTTNRSVLQVLEARPMVDTKPPQTYMHLHLKLKKLQLEEERLATIERDNRILLEKMSFIMRTRGRIDNRNNYEYKSLNREKRKQELLRVTQENQEILKRITARKPEYNHKTWEKEWDRNQEYMDSISAYPRDWWKYSQQQSGRMLKRQDSQMSESRGTSRRSKKQSKHEEETEEESRAEEEETKQESEASDRSNKSKKSSKGQMQKEHSESA